MTSSVDATSTPQDKWWSQRSNFPASVAKRLNEYLDDLNDKTKAVVELSGPEDIREKFKESGVPLTLTGEQPSHGKEDLMDALEVVLQYSVRTGHPLFFNQLYGRAHPASIGGDWISTALNTNCHTYEVAPVFTLMEQEILKKMGEVIGGKYADSVDGLFVPGGSISNIYGMHLARSAVNSDYLECGSAGGPICVAFTSDQSHYSYLKSARLMGLGSANLISVASDDKGCMQPSALKEAIIKAKNNGHRPFFVGATSGTTVVGAYDPLNEIAQICEDEGMWLHVDACWGGSALFSSKPERRSLMEGAGRADSIAWNPHKMLGSTLQSSIFVTRHTKRLAATNGTQAAYLFQPDKLYTELDSGDKTIQCGRKTDMMKVWYLWKAIGDKGIARSTDHCFDLAEVMANAMSRDKSGAWQLVYQPSCTNVNFWYIPEKLRPFDFATATPKQLEKIHKVAPLIKAKMQKNGDALIGFQSVNGRPNFFRMVFASCDIVSEKDVLLLMERIASTGELITENED